MSHPIPPPAMFSPSQLPSATGTHADPLDHARSAILVPAALDENRVASILGEVMGHAVDYSDVYFQAVREESWSLEDGIVKDGAHSIDRGVGVRALAGERTGFAYSDEVVLPALLESARAARAIARSGSTGALQAWHAGGGRDLYLPIDPIDTLDDRDKVRLLEEIDREARALDPRISQVMASLSASHETIMVLASDGTLAADVRPLVRLNVSVIIEHEGHHGLPEHPAEPAQPARELRLGRHLGEPRGDLAERGVRAGRGHDGDTVSRDDRGPEEHAVGSGRVDRRRRCSRIDVARRLLQRGKGFAGERGLLHVEATRFDELRIGRHEIARREAYEVTHDELRARHLAPRAVTRHRRGGDDDLAQPLGGVGGAHGLDGVEQHAEHDGRHDDQRIQRLARPRRDAARREEDQHQRAGELRRNVTKDADALRPGELVGAGGSETPACLGLGEAAER